MVKASKLYHINLNVKDIDRSARFYHEALGLIERFCEGPRMVFMGPPDSDDVITLSQALPVGPHGVSHFGFRVAGGSLDEVVGAAVNAGASLVSKGAHAPGVPFAYIRDPDGYLIELSPEPYPKS